MKKSRTRKAVEFLANQADDTANRDARSTKTVRESVYAVAKRFKLDPAGLSRAWKRYRSQKRCDECGQVIR